MVGIVQHFYSDTVADGPYTSVVRPSDWNSVHSQHLTLSGNTLGASTLAGTNIVIAGGSNITLSADTLNSKLSIIGENTASQSNQTVGLYAGSNTTLATSATVDARSLSFEGAGAISVGASNGSIVISANAAAADGNNVIEISGNTSGTTTSFSSATIVLAGGNNITLSQSSNTITIVGGAGGAGFSAGLSTVGNTQGNTGTVSNQIVFSGGNNITLSQATGAGGATIGISGPNTAAQTNQQGSLYVSSNSFGTSSGTYDARTLSFAGSGAVNVAASNSGIVISAPVQTVQPLSHYAESQSFGTSSGTVGQNLSISGSGLVSVAVSNGGMVIYATSAAQTNQQGSLYAVSTTTGTSSGTYDARSLSIAGAGIISVAASNSGFVISATTAAQSNQQISAYAVGNTTLSTSRTMNASAFSIAGSGAISVGASNGSIVISANAAAADGVNIVSASGNTSGTLTTYSSGTIVLAGGGNITMSQSSNTITILGPANSTITEGNMVTISTAGSTVTIDAFANIVSASGNTSGTLTTFSSGTMVLAGGDNVTLSQSSNTITISAGGGGVSTGSIYATSNTFGTSSGTLNISHISIAGSGAVAVAASNGGWVVSAPTQTVQPLSAYAESQSFGTSSGTIGQNLSISGSGIISVAVSNGGLVLNATTSQSVQPASYYVESQSFGTSSGTVGQSLSISGSGIISVAVSNGGLVLSATTAAQTNQSIGLYASSQTVGQSSSSTVDARSITVVGQGIVSAGISAGSLLISATTPSQTAQTIGVYASSQTVGQSSSSTVDARSFTHVGQGIVSVGLSAGSLLISATTPTQTNQQGSLYAVSTTTGTSSGTYDARSISIAGAGIVSVAASNSGFVISATTAAQTNQTIGAYATGAQTTAQSSSTTFDARSVSFSGAGGVSVGMSTTGAGGAVVVISGATGGGGGSNLSAYAVSNTTLGTSGNLSLSALSFEGAGNVSVGVSNGSVVISGATAAGLTQVSAYAVSNTTLGTSTPVVMTAFSIEGAGGVSAGASNGSIVVSAPVQSYLIGTSGISLSSSSNSISIMTDPTAVISQLEPFQFGNNSSASTLGQSSIYFQHFEVGQPLQFCRIDRLVSFTQNAAVSGSSNHTGTRSNTWGYTESVALFTRGTGTNSTALYSLASNSWSIGLTESVSITTTASNAVGISQSGTFGFIGNIDTNGGSTSSTFNSNAGASGAATSTSYSNNLSNITGTCILNIPFGSTVLSPGDYWLAILASYTAGGSGGTSTNLGTMANIILTNLNAGLKLLGQTATATSNVLVLGNGVGNAQTAAIPSSIALNVISNNSNASLYFNLLNASL